MGLFDRFKKRVNEVIDETDIEKISADSESEEAKEIIAVSYTHLTLPTR